MAFSHTNSRGTTYFLHRTTAMLKNGREQTLYFFSKEEKDGALELLPDGFEITESRNGLPVLRRSQKHDS